VRVRRTGGLSEPVEITGIVADTTWGALREERQPIMYTPLSQNADPGRGMDFVIRTDTDLSALGRSIKASVGEAHPRLTVTLTSLTRDEFLRPRARR
jgi:hypothetical protein